MDLELHNAFILTKHEWDSIALDRVEIACNPAQQADVAAVIMHEGLANVCLITQHLTINRQKIEHTIPRKRKGLCAQHDKGMEKFFDTIIAAINKHIDFSVVKVVIVASPGFIKDQFYQYMLTKAARDDDRHLLENRTKFILLHSSNGFKHALTEILQDPLIANRLSDTKAAGEMKLLDQFMQLLNDEPEKAYYGLEVVERANQHQAVECKVISSHRLDWSIVSLSFRSDDHGWTLSQYWFHQTTSLRSIGGLDQGEWRWCSLVLKVSSISPLLRIDPWIEIHCSMHVSGERLGQLTGIAAILRFPMADLDLADEHHEAANNDAQDLEQADLQRNSNRTVNHLDQPDDDDGDDDDDDEDEERPTGNHRTLDTASAW